MNEGIRIQESNSQEETINEDIPIEESEGEGQETIRKLSALARKYPRLSNSINTIILAWSIGGGMAGVKLSYDIAYEGLRDYIEVEYPDTRARETVQIPDLNHREILKQVQEAVYVPTYWVTEVDSIESPQEREELAGIPPDVRVKGFESFSLSNEVVESIIEETLPAGLARSIGEVSYVDIHKSMPLRYGMKLAEHSEEAGSASTFRRKIEIVKGAKKSSISWFAHELLTHEAFHLGDMESNLFLTVNERIEIYKKILDRVKSGDRFKSNYVESISNPDKRKEMREKVKEYFAEIGSTYLSPDYALLPEADRRIVEEFIAKIDPDFDRIEALNKRRKLIGESIPEIKSLKEFTEEYLGYVQTAEELSELIREDLKKNGREITPKIEEKIIILSKEWHEESKKNAVANAVRNYNLEFERLKKMGEIK